MGQKYNDFLTGQWKKWGKMCPTFGAKFSLFSNHIPFLVHGSIYRPKTVSLPSKILKRIGMNIGDNLRRVREKQKISQQEVADFLGVDRKTYERWEFGEADIKSSYIPKIAEFLHIEISDLFREKASEIVINQHYSENKDSSINGMVLLLTDKEAIDQLVDVMKTRLKKE